MQILFPNFAFSPVKPPTHKRLLKERSLKKTLLKRAKTSPSPQNYRL